MKERPILFSGAMVRAILDGRKTQTRRVLKQAVGPSLSVGIEDEPGVAELSWLSGPGPGYDVEETVKRVSCPYGQPGDRLWVRESFWGCDAPGYGDTPCVVYDDEWHGKEYRAAEIRPWAPKFGRIPSIHMPRNCSRILLDVTDVRVERLNDCSEEDARVEGVERVMTPPIWPTFQVGHYWKGYMNHQRAYRDTALDSYRSLWESINGAGAWDANPWVWVVEFRRVV